jgi:hypothetical protein
MSGASPRAARTSVTVVSVWPTWMWMVSPSSMRRRATSTRSLRTTGTDAVGAAGGGVDGGDDLTGERVELAVIDVFVADLDDAHSPGDGGLHGLGDAATGGLALRRVGDEVEARVDSGEAVGRVCSVVHGRAVISRVVSDVGGTGSHAWMPSLAVSFAEVSVSRLTLACASRSPSTPWSASRKFTE